MERYRVTYKNGAYPLTYESESIAACYECLCQLACGIDRIAVDPDALIVKLAQLSGRTTRAYESEGWRVERADE